jgi:thioredoxin reductase (NADPH)
MVSDHISKVDLGSHPFRLWGDGGDTYSCEALVIATGAQAKWLDIPSEQSFQGFGVSACATCDGFFFRNREVIVVGGGNSAVEESLYLANLASKVTLVHRRDSLRAEKILQDRLLKHPKVDVIWDSAVDEICGVLPGGEGTPGVTHVRLKNLKTGALLDVKTDGVFIAIGHKPSTDLFIGQVAMKDSGYIITKPNSTATNIPGVFAAGDVADDTYRQAVTAAGLGCMAALEAEKWLAAQESGRMAAE